MACARGRNAAGPKPMLYKLDIIQEKGIERENRASISSQRYAKFLMISNL